MARTREQWNELIGAPENLSGLSDSAAAEWHQVRNLAVTAAINVEATQELNKQDIKDTNARKQAQSVWRWPSILKEYQHGDTWTIGSDGIGKYAVIDASKQIVKLVTVNEDEEGKLTFKVAKLSGGDLVPLSSTELDGLRDYAKARRAPGLRITLRSLPADSVIYTLNYRYNPRYNKTDLEAAIDVALTNFRDNLEADGITEKTNAAIFYKSQVIAAIENIPGIESVVIRIDMTLDNGAVEVEDVQEQQELPAGYFNWHDDSSKTGVSI